MTGADVRVERIAGEDIDRLVGWAADEGWNPGHEDARCFASADPEGFLGAWMDGRMVGGVSAVRYGDALSFVGLFIVLPGLRGRGIGRALWDAAMDRCGGTVSGLEGVVAMQDSYARSGFRLAHRSLRYAGTLHRADAGTSGVVELGGGDVDAVGEVDTACFGAARPRFLRAWLGQADARSFAVAAGGRVTGYVTVRPCRVGYKLGPVFAADESDAAALVAAVRAHVGDDAAVSLDVPEANLAAVRLAEGLGMTVSFETARMYRGGELALPLDRVFGITTLELG